MIRKKDPKCTKKINKEFQKNIKKIRRQIPRIKIKESNNQKRKNKPK